MLSISFSENLYKVLCIFTHGNVTSSPGMVSPWEKNVTLNLRKDKAFGDALEWNFYKPSQRKNGRKELPKFTRKFYFLMIPSVFRPMTYSEKGTCSWESFWSRGRKKSLSFNHKSKNRIFRKCWDTSNVSGNACEKLGMLRWCGIYFENLLSEETVSSFV